MALQYATIGSNGNLINLDAADVDGDGSVTVSDAIIILRMALNIIDK